MALLCLPSFKVEVLFTVSDYPRQVKKLLIYLYRGLRLSWYKGAFAYRGLHRISVNTPTASLRSEFGHVRFSSELTDPVSPSYSEQAKYIYDWYCRKCYLFLLASD